MNLHEGGWEAAGGEGGAQEAGQQGEDRPKHRGQVEGEVDRDGVQRVAGGRPHRAEAQVRLEPRHAVMQATFLAMTVTSGAGQPNQQLVLRAPTR